LTQLTKEYQIYIGRKSREELPRTKG